MDMQTALDQLLRTQAGVAGSLSSGAHRPQTADDRAPGWSSLEDPRAR